MDEDRIRPLSNGVNQSGVRDYNERLLLTMLQRGGAMPGSNLARVAGLSPQTVSVILRKLEKDGILERGAPTKGKVGKPSVPMRLAPDGVLSFGLKIGRRTADLVLMDFLGQVRAQLTTTYPYPMPNIILSFLGDGLHETLATLTPDEQTRICGLGIAAPFELWHWNDKVGAPEPEFQSWKDVDFFELAGTVTELPVSTMNDATAACQAEHVFGRGKEFRDFAYFYIGAFIGGGIVLNHSLFEGSFKNAGAFGPMRSVDAKGNPAQLIDTASLYLLENEIVAAGHARRSLWVQPQDWSAFSELVDVWTTQTAFELAKASLSTCAVIDFEAIVVDGAVPDAIKQTLVSRIRAEIDRQDKRGLITPRVEAGKVGVNARAIGAAYHPIFQRFLLNTNASLSA
jgi:predicted NBD/HSP70 family sugar kinase